MRAPVAPDSKPEVRRLSSPRGGIKEIKNRLLDLHPSIRISDQVHGSGLKSEDAALQNYRFLGFGVHVILFHSAEREKNAFTP